MTLVLTVRSHGCLQHMLMQRMNNDDRPAGDDREEEEERKSASEASTGQMSLADAVAASHLRAGKNPICT